MEDQSQSRFCYRYDYNNNSNNSNSNYSNYSNIVICSNSNSNSNNINNNNTIDCNLIIFVALICIWFSDSLPFQEVTNKENGKSTIQQFEFQFDYKNLRKLMLVS